MTAPALVALAHGSRDPRSAATVRALIDEVRRMLDYLKLPFDPACLAFHENKRAVRTASSEQVRRPISRDGLDQWRMFEPWLGSLENSLGANRHQWRD